MDPQTSPTNSIRIQSKERLDSKHTIKHIESKQSSHTCSNDENKDDIKIEDSDHMILINDTIDLINPIVFYRKKLEVGFQGE